MTRDEAMERILDMIGDAYASGAVDVHSAWVADLGQIEPDFGEATSDYKASVAEAAATVIQQAFAEREVGMIEALKPFAHYYRLNDCEGRPDDDAIEVPIGDLRFAALALAAKGDSRG